MNILKYLLSLMFLLLLLTDGSKAQGSQTDLEVKQIKKAMLKALRWQEANPIYAKALTDWTNGAYYTGVSRAHKITQHNKYKKALIKMGERNDWQPYDRFYHADDMAICYSYLYLKSLGVESVDLRPTVKIIRDHLFDPHDWKTGQDEMKKILWWWCDALFMAPPVITYYRALTDTADYLNKMHAYYTQTYDLLFDQEEKLFARDIRFLWNGDSLDRKEGNGKKIFWSRGNGWVLGGLALTLDNMPKDYQYRPFYENLFRDMAAKIQEIQPEDGLWRTSLLYPEAYDHGEVSGSGFYTFALAYGVNHGLLDPEEYRPTIIKAWRALAECQHPGGKVGWVQNIGFDPKPASAESWQNYGTGAFLLAGSEVVNLLE